jgi:hypothetical protein
MTRFGIGLGFLLLGVLGCGDGNSPNNSDGGSDPDLICDANVASVLTSKVHAEVFTAKDTCTGVGCHGLGNTTTVSMIDSAATQGVVGMKSAYSGTDATLKVVDPGKLANSSLWLKVLGGSPAKKGPKGESVGGPMPEGKQELNATQLKLIKDWICSGAKAQ